MKAEEGQNAGCRWSIWHEQILHFEIKNITWRSNFSFLCTDIQINNKPASFMALISFRMALGNKSFSDVLLKARLEPVQGVCVFLETIFTLYSTDEKHCLFLPSSLLGGYSWYSGYLQPFKFFFFYFCILLISSVHRRLDSEVTLHGSEDFTFLVF